MQRREMYVQIKASGSGDGQGTHGRQGLMSSWLREGAPTPKRLTYTRSQLRAWLGTRGGETGRRPLLRVRCRTA
jgi:hypothetical protein